MQQTQRLRNNAAAIALALAANTAAVAIDDDDEFPAGGDCAGLEEGARGLCNAYCNAQDCPSHPNKNSCVVLRRNFERQTGSSMFPCDSGLPTATATSSRTATALPPSRTPTDTPAATATSTATANSPTVTATSVHTPTATVATATATATGDLPATATATEPLATVTATATATGVPTGTTTAMIGGARCMGDCSDDGDVDISDLTQCLLIVLGDRDPFECANGRRDGSQMRIGDLVVAVRHALEGCR